jgi:NAD(P)-dependent dehydrogenase (short-subunit alcohol dehydrogenase family)
VSTHALVVGGTGMLCDAAVELARSTEFLTSIARTEASLRALDARISKERCRHAWIALDYRDTAMLRTAVRDAVARHGPIEVLLAWVHEEQAPNAVLALAEEALRDANDLHLFHVLGNAAADPSRSLAERRRPFEALPGLRYHQIILGFVQLADGSRWLTNDEISAGVIAAIRRGAAESVVGTVRPWSARP